MTSSGKGKARRGVLAKRQVVFHHAAWLVAAISVRENALVGGAVTIAKSTTTRLAQLPRLVDQTSRRRTVSVAVDAEAGAGWSWKPAAAVVVKRRFDRSTRKPIPELLRR